MPPPEPSLLADTYSAAVLTLWGDKDEEATKTWMGRHARSLLSVPSPNEHERLAFVLFF
jgi:dsRNA-specific ribonuclease